MKKQFAEYPLWADMGCKGGKMTEASSAVKKKQAGVLGCACTPTLAPGGDCPAP